VALLGETSFGIFSLAWVLIGYLSFLDIGVNRAATKFISEHLAEGGVESVQQVVQSAFAANLALGLAGGALVALFTPYLVHSVFKVSPGLNRQAELAFYAVAVAVPVLLLQGIFRAAVTSYQRFGWINGINAVASGLQWGAAVCLAWRGYGVSAVVCATVVARIGATAVYGVLLFRTIPGLRLVRGGLHGLSRLLRFGGWVSVSQVVSPLLVYLDRAVIASFVSLAAVTVYTVPYELITRLRIIPSSLVSTLYPAFSERGLQGQEADLQRLYEGSVRYLWLLVVPAAIFLVVLGPDLMTLWMGGRFAQQSAGVLQILAVGALANGIAYVPYNILQALGRPDLTGKFHLLELVPYAFLCLTLIPRWGIAGAAVASSVRFGLDCGLLFWAVGKYCQCSLRTFWAGSFPRTLALAAGFGLTLAMIRFDVADSRIRLALGLLVVIGYFLVVWAVILESAEKPRITRAVRVFLGQQSA
jgi:O-antigen/teichoic acid export membrane protein